jgi:arylsulfatase A-like enzyme
MNLPKSTLGQKYLIKTVMKHLGIGIGIGDGMHPSVDSNGDKKFAYNRPEEENLWDPTQLPHRPPSIPENHPDFKSNKNLTEIEKTYASMVKILDEHVGVIIEELKTLGLYENTIIVLSGYNGHEIYYPSKGKIDKPMLNMQTGEKFDNVHTKYYSELVGDVFSGNDGMAGMKRDNWEGAVRVPLIYH